MPRDLGAAENFLKRASHQMFHFSAGSTVTSTAIPEVFVLRELEALIGDAFVATSQNASS